MRVRVSCGRTRGRAVVRSAPRSYVMPRGRTLEPGYRTTTSEKVRPRRVGYDRAREGTTTRGCKSGARGIGQRGTLRLASLRWVLCGFAGRAEGPDVTAPPSNRSRRVPTACRPPPRSRDMTRPAAPGCLSRPAGPCRRGARTPGSHIRGSASSFAGAIGAGSLRPASTSVTDRSTGSPTLTTRPVRRQ